MVKSCQNSQIIQYLGQIIAKLETISTLSSTNLMWTNTKWIIVFWGIVFYQLKWIIIWLHIPFWPKYSFGMNRVELIIWFDLKADSIWPIWFETWFAVGYRHCRFDLGSNWIAKIPTRPTLVPKHLHAICSSCKDSNNKKEKLSTWSLNH